MVCDRRATSAADVTGTSIARARVHEERSLRFPIVGVLRIGQRCRNARSSREVGWSRRPHGRASDRDAPIELVAERGGHGDSREIVRTAERDADSPPIDRPARRRSPPSFGVGADSSRGAEVAEASRIAGSCGASQTAVMSLNSVCNRAVNVGAPQRPRPKAHPNNKWPIRAATRRRANGRRCGRRVTDSRGSEMR